VNLSVDNQSSPVAFTWWIFTAPVAAAVGGLIVTLLLCRLKGFNRFRLRELLGFERHNFVWLAVIDGFGAFLLALVIWVVKPERSARLLEFESARPYVFWPIMGVLGPFVAVGVLRLFPVGLSVNMPSVANGQASLVRIRGAITNAVYDTAEQLTEVWNQTLKDWLFGYSKELHSRGLFQFDDLVDRVSRKNKKDPRGHPLPRKWRDFQREKDQWPTDQDPGDCTVRMVSAALRARYWNEVATTCGVKISDFDFDAAYVPAAQVRKPIDIAPGGDFPPLEKFEEWEGE
jgi:hypothetical protein